MAMRIKTGRGVIDVAAASQIFLTDVSQSCLDEECGMKYWFNRLEGDFGIVPRDHIVSYALDTEVHNDLRTLSQMADIRPEAVQEMLDDVLSKLTPADRADVQKMELLYRRLGWVAAFAVYIEPRVREEFETLPCDPAIVLDRDPLFLCVYPDRLLKDRKTGEIVYREYQFMPAGLTSRKWLQSWHYHIRLHAGLAAAANNEKPCAYGQVMSLSRGFRSLIDDRLSHPYVWGYCNRELHEWTHVLSERRSGVWELMPVWEFEGGIVQWVKQLGLSVAEKQFQLSPPVYLNQSILDGWVARRIHREREIACVKGVAKENHYMRATYFGRSTGQCQPQNGEACPYLKVCWDTRRFLKPLEGQEFILNQPGTLTELVQP